MFDEFSFLILFNTKMSSFNSIPKELQFGENIFINGEGYKIIFADGSEKTITFDEIDPKRVIDTNRASAEHSSLKFVDEARNFAISNIPSWVDSNICDMPTQLINPGQSIEGKVKYVVTLFKNGSNIF